MDAQVSAMLPVLETGSTTEICNKLQEFNKENAQTFVFSHLETKTKEGFVSGLLKVLESKTEPECVHLCLEAIRILSREKTRMSLLERPQAINAILRHAGYTNDCYKINPEVITEAQKCLCNLIYLSTAVQRICGESDECTANLVARIKQYHNAAITDDIKLCGCALVGLGLYLCLEPNMRSYAASSSDLHEYYIALYCIIGIGGLMMLVGFLGCCGACAENRFLLVMFFTLLLLICVAEVGGGFYAYFNQDKFQTLVKDSMADTMLKRYPEEPIGSAVDLMQTELMCCGSTGPEMWKSPNRTSGEHDIPESCCVGGDCGIVKIYQDGCSTKLFELLERNLVLVAGLTIGIGVVQFLGLIFSCCLCIAIGRQEKEKEYI